MKELLEKLESEAYSDEELEKLITFIWKLEDKHPQFWTRVCQRLIITMRARELKSKLNSN